MIGLGLSLTQVAGRGGWSPARLPGLMHWRGGSDPASGRLYTDSTGATPVATFGETVGLLARAAGTVNAIQTTGANRPVSGRWPRGGRRNLLTHTEALTDAAWGGYWVKPALAAHTPSISARGATHRVTYDPATGGGGSGRQAGLLYNGPAALTAGQYAIRFLMRANSRVPASFGIGHGGSTATMALYVDGVLVSGPTATTTLPMAGFLVVGQVHQVEVRITRSDTSGNNRLFEWRIEDGAGGLGTCTFDIAEVQTEAGATATPSQRVGATANDVTETGRETVWHIAATGAQALPLTLSAGAYTRAWVDSTGAVTVTRDLTETTAANTAPEGRSVDAVVVAGSMTADDEARIRAWWGRYSAG